MRYIKTLNEMADIEKKGKKLLIQDRLLKDVSIDELNNNIIYYRQDVNNFFKSKGWTMVWFIKDEQSAKELSQNSENLLFFPAKHYNNSPITDIWLRNKGISKNIIGVLEAYTDDEVIFIDMMSVRKGFMSNGINNFMIKTLVQKNPNAILKFSTPTKMGESFIKKYYPKAKIEGIIDEKDIEYTLNKLKTGEKNNLITNRDIVEIAKKLLPNLPSKNDFRKDNSYYDKIWELMEEYVKNN